MSLKTTMLADLQTIETDMGSPTFTWKNQDYTCIPASNNTAAALEEGGFAVEIDMILNVRTDLFGDDIYPAKQETLTYNSKTYRINKVTLEPVGGFIQLLLFDINRGV